MRPPQRRSSPGGSLLPRGWDEYGAPDIRWNVGQPPNAGVVRALQVMNLAGLQTLGGRGQGVHLVIVDTGVDSRLSDVRLAPNSPLNFASQTDSATTDSVGHGSLCARLAAGRGGDDRASIGFAPDALLASCKVVTEPSPVITAVFTAAQMQRLAIAARNHRVVACVALSAPALMTSGERASLQGALDALTAAGVLVIAAAGNDHPRADATCDGAELRLPAAHASVVAVAGWDIDAGRPLDVSSRGFAAQVAKPDICGPVSPSSLAPRRDGWDPHRSGWQTSGACALVAGCAAAVWSAHPQATAAMVANAMKASAATLPGDVRCVGAGMVDAGAAAARLRTGV